MRLSRLSKRCTLEARKFPVPSAQYNISLLLLANVEHEPNSRNHTKTNEHIQLSQSASIEPNRKTYAKHTFGENMTRIMKHQVSGEVNGVIASNVAIR